MAFIQPISTGAFLSQNGARSSFTRASSPARNVATPITPMRPRRSVLHMSGGGPSRTTVTDTPRKQFMDRLKPLGKVRLVARNDAAIMEAIATFDGLFFASIRSGEYANIVDMSINLDMHLLLDGISGARFETGVSRSASKAPTYIVRILQKDKESVAISLFLQWDKDPSDIDPARIEAWQQLKKDYVAGDGDTFFFDE